MRISHTLIPSIRMAVVSAFFALCASILAFLWLHAGGQIPLVSEDGYRVSVTLPDVDNLVFQSDVRMAGVNVGKVKEIKIDGRNAKVTLELDADVAPLHSGAAITVRNKTLIEETYLDVADGKGKKIAAGSKLPDGSAKVSVQLNDVMTSLDQPTRDRLAGLLKATGKSTKDSKGDVDDLLQGLGDLGREGGGALEALAAQSADLAELIKSSTVVLNSLDTRQGRIVQLARDSDSLTETIADNKTDIESLMRKLPTFMETTREASTELTRLADPLGIVARNLKAGSTDLSAALEELPVMTRDLRGLLPSLDGTLTRAPATLTRVSTFTGAARPVISSLETDMADINPMLAYLKPYGRDIASQFTNFAEAASGSDANGNIGRLMLLFSANSVNSPLKLSPGVMYNPYPTAGSHYAPKDFSGEYPRVREDDIP